MDNTLSEAGYEMLRAAVDAARHHQCKSVEQLKQRLVATYPGSRDAIDEALRYWSADIRRRHPNGVPNH